MKKTLLSIGLTLIMVILLSGCENKTAGGYYREGKKLFADRKYEEAAASFEQAITQKPNKAKYHVDYGMVLISLGKYEEAITELDSIYMNKNIKIIQENNKRIHRGKGIAYYHLLQYDDAIKQFDLALGISELSELDMDILYYKGNIQKILGIYEDALETYTSIIEIDKDNARAHGEVSYIYRQLKEYDKSLEECDKAIKLEPGCFEYYFNKYYLMIENNNDTQALEVLQTAEKIKIKSEEDKYNLAKVHYYQGSHDTALSELNESYDAGFTEAYFYIGEIYNKKREYSLAVYYYDQYIEKEQNCSPTVYNNIGYCLMKLDEYQRALDYLDKGIAYQHVGVQHKLLKNEIVAYEKLGMFEKAQEKLSDYIRLYPDNKEAINENVFLNTRVGN